MRLTEEHLRRLCGITHEAAPCCTDCHGHLGHGFAASVIEIDGNDVDVCCAVTAAFTARLAEIDHEIADAKRRKDEVQSHT